MSVAFRGQPSGDFVLDTIQLSSKCGRVCGARDAVLRAPRLHLSFRNNMLISPCSEGGSGFAKCRCSHWWSVRVLRSLHEVSAGCQHRLVQGHETGHHNVQWCFPPSTLVESKASCLSFTSSLRPASILRQA